MREAVRNRDYLEERDWESEREGGERGGEKDWDKGRAGPHRNSILPVLYCRARTLSKDPLRLLPCFVDSCSYIT